jgi:hypothetical protein
MFFRATGLFLLLLPFLQCFAQTGGSKGYIKDVNSGVEIENVFVQFEGTEFSDFSNEDGFYIITGVPAGKYKLIANITNHKADTFEITVKAGAVNVHNFYMTPIVYTLAGGKVRDRRKKRKQEEINIGKTSIRPAQMQKIPTVGGTPDLVQYLQVLPGVVFSGDQGGQLYIRGGSPVMNKILLDGMTIYNPFHSIGLFSIFDVDIMKSADVYSAGFGAEYGGRISAIVDVKTRDGNKKRLAGNVAISPFLGKVSLEGPLKKFIPGRGSSSFMVSIKNSYLDRSSKVFYQYADPDKLPYSFNDVYGKLSFNSSNGSNIKIFGFNFKDRVNFPNSTKYNWNQTGLGTSFTMIPEGKQSKLDGFITYSDYAISQEEIDNKPRFSQISGLNMGLHTVSYRKKDEIKYGFEINAFSTDFTLFNSNNRQIQQEEFTTELCGFALYKFVRKRFALESGLRLQYYASLGNTSIEPRINGKYAISPKLTFKGGFGRYSQNLLSAFSDRDVVNLFYGFLSGPDNLQNEFNGKAVTSRLQKAWHGVGGFDYDFNRNSEIGVEAFYKDFTQITNINREKLFDDDGDYSVQPERLKKDFIVESGDAYGADIHYKYDDNKRLYIWAVYSLTYVNRFDGINTYNPHWDRRHNVNLVLDYAFGKSKRLSANARWNYGSGFPFTQTVGFYEKYDFQSGPSTDYINGNGDLGIVYGGFNQGRLPVYHRLDMSVKYRFKTVGTFKSWIVFSVTNVYDRKNIFYFDRGNYTRVNQLPVLPALSFNASF